MNRNRVKYVIVYSGPERLYEFLSRSPENRHFWQLTLRDALKLSTRKEAEVVAFNAVSTGVDTGRNARLIGNVRVMSVESLLSETRLIVTDGAAMCPQCGTKSPWIKPWRNQWVEPWLAVRICTRTHTRIRDKRVQGTPLTDTTLRGEHYHATCKNCLLTFTLVDNPNAHRAIAARNAKAAPQSVASARRVQHQR